MGIYQERVTGAGGRPRTIWTGCHYGCWHGSYRQAVKCVERYDAAVAKAAAADRVPRRST